MEPLFKYSVDSTPENQDRLAAQFVEHGNVAGRLSDTGGIVAMCACVECLMWVEHIAYANGLTVAHNMVDEKRQHARIEAAEAALRRFVSGLGAELGLSVAVTTAALPPEIKERLERLLNSGGNSGSGGPFRNEHQS